MELAVIADDLTGANDTGVQFANRGLSTTVLFSDTELQSSHLSEDVIVLNSDSRALDFQKAYDIVFKLSTELNRLGVTNVFKKIDSTMRGNIGQEIDAVMDVFQFKTSFVVPAFPKSKRTTVEGKHYVNGVLLADSEMSNDPSCPVKQSYLPELLEEQSKRDIQLISISDVQKGKDHILEKMLKLTAANSSQIIVIDATTDEELKAIVEAAEALKEKFLWVGSAGVASHLSSTGGNRKEVLQSNQSDKRPPVLVVAGSVNMITNQQIHDLKKGNNVEEIVISPEAFFDNDKRKYEIDRIVQSGQALLAKGDLVITTDRGQEARNRVKQLKQELDLSNFDVGYTIAESMGMIAGYLIEANDISGAVLTGGDISGATCKALKGEGIRVIGEVEPGIPYGQLFGGLFDGLPVVTKAGAFGTEQALSKALETITKVQGPVMNNKK
ncbi:four-carbon acid sugar kinase family protein [Oceanobacillus oncorhynchi]|uniref:four-carbon acid sugar kinase family protein n=1 Tax=Oceanobacillus oncorhynchi TaxID=545501 RepID=UPI0025A3E352|nr:four-carbon acid sugar kinase family protein [Oceanobacillus oncorhynchi]MDM8102443.1 four-carbon acid sugar kinase family protein [Oceanobacillus oncorhynchi]